MNEATTPPPRSATRTWVARHPALSITAKALYSVLDSYADAKGMCWPSNTRLMSDLRISLSPLQRAMRELQEIGVYSAEQRGKKRFMRMLHFASRGVSTDTQNLSSKKLAELASLAPTTGKESKKRGVCGDTPVDNSAATAPELGQRASAADQPRSVDAVLQRPIRELDTEGVELVRSWVNSIAPWSQNGHRRRR
jgi:hypothetical protein